MAALALHRRIGTLVGIGAILAVVATGCGDEEPDVSSQGTAPTASAEPSTGTGQSAEATDLPACARVWKVGERLPGGYDGCAEDGAAVAADVLRCSSGQALVRYADRYYAVKGGEIRKASGPLRKDKTYVDHAVACRG